MKILGVFLLLLCANCLVLDSSNTLADKVNGVAPQPRQLFIPPNFGSGTPNFVRGALDHYLQSLRMFNGMPYNNAQYVIYKDNPFLNAQKTMYLPYSLMGKATAAQDLISLSLIPPQMYPLMAMNEKVTGASTHPGFLPTMAGSIGTNMLSSGFGMFPSPMASLSQMNPGLQSQNNMSLQPQSSMPISSVNNSNFPSENNLQQNQSEDTAEFKAAKALN